MALQRIVQELFSVHRAILRWPHLRVILLHLMSLTLREVGLGLQNSLVFPWKGVCFEEQAY